MSEQQGNKANSVDVGGEDKRKPTKRQQATEEDDDHSEKEVRREDDENYNGEKRQGMRRPHEPIVMERGATGSVKWFSLHKGYGFIRVDGSDDEIFMHASSIIRSVQRPLALAENQKVEFDVIKGPKGFEAICISGPGGMRVGRIIDFGDGRPFYSRYNGPPPRMGINGPHRNRQPAIENKAEENKSGEKEQNAEAEAKKNGREEIKKKDAGVEKKKGMAGENVKEEESNKEKKVDQQQRGGGKGKKYYRNRKDNKNMAKKKEDGGAGTEKEQKKQNEEGKEKAANGNEKKAADEDKKTESDGKDEESEVEGHSQGQKETGGTAE